MYVNKLYCSEDTEPKFSLLYIVVYAYVYSETETK